MLNFTVGPVEIDKNILEIGRNPVPYFRTVEFSNIMKENEKWMCELSKAPKDSSAIFLTGSGTSAMEAVVMNCFSEEDNVLVINGGSFGKRFVELCNIHNIKYSEIKLKYGQTINADILSQYDNQGYTALLVNIHETSTGVYYDPVLLSDFCTKNKMFFVVDAVSSFLADKFDMETWGVNVMLTGSQKALAVPPGISILVLDSIAKERVLKNKCRCMYLDLKSALKNAERGQTPFTPAVGILLQIHARLRQLHIDGYEMEMKRIKNIAEDFRKKIENLPLKFFSSTFSNAVTALETRENVDAYRVFELLKDENNIWVCPNGGELSKRVFRVGHIGALTTEDNDVLINALNDLWKRGEL